ncbi:hypothetical protein [Microbacterium marinilacus]|uniref:Uncharacterized protein n=1 Tax=Microbacterium marinilacus TaxID=415209 RepID=A0ABP7BLI6_9MICO|nr:hypothetical protein [Microbacterium marinilacus]MBY0688830.1 hypothetical protein [Microbacterium marinilacus]
MPADETAPPLGYTPEPLEPRRVVIEFDVLARSDAEAEHLVNEVLIEELTGSPDQLRADGDRVYGEDFGDDVSHIRSWTPRPASVHSATAMVVPSVEWSAFEESGIPEIVAGMFPPEPAEDDFRVEDGTVDFDRLEDARDRWRDERLALAMAASRLPETLARLNRAERVHGGLIDLVEREPLPVEPRKEDYLVTVSPSYEGEYEDARYRWDHVQWEADFKAASRRRESALQDLLDDDGSRTSSLRERLRQVRVSDLVAIQTLREVVERDRTGSGERLLDGSVREHLEEMLFAADPDVQVTDPDDPVGPPIYEGPASEAHAWIVPGVYAATGLDGHGEFRLVVGPVPFGHERTASAAFPPAERDSTVVNEIARILEQHTESHTPDEVLAQINQAVLRTGRTGMLTPGPVEPPTLLERGGLLSELLAERERDLSAGPDGLEPPETGRGTPGRRF